jgi:hypothetical protein
MKLHSLVESYFEGLYHIGKTKDLTLENLKVEKPAQRADLTLGKPLGGGNFWLAKGLSWHKWATGENFHDTGNDYLYRVKLKSTAKILQTDGRKFPEKYRDKSRDKEGVSSFLPPRIDYHKVAQDYDGVQAYHLAPFTMWDVPTIVVWNKDAIESMESLGLVRNAIAKSKKNRGVSSQ